ncbi:MAG: response regulator transcription factor [Candidatus Dormibacteraeota bacterium]|jgi:DNA-binding NarL/FixJ family response regulator|nr:response regulator transcription factor [Candidatus Dormibacteraeota bacterium]
MTEQITIVIAEDHTLVREGTREILDREPDFTIVGEAARGDEAVQMTLELRPKVLLMDMRMPGLTGIEATRKLAPDLPELKILILSAHEDEDYVREALASGASGYLLKTSPGTELVEGVRAVAAGSTVLSPSLTRKLAQVRLDPSRATDRLSSREFAVLRLIAQGRANKEIALELGISLRTVEGHLHNIFEKLRVGSRTEAVVHAVNHGLLSIESPGNT